METLDSRTSVFGLVKNLSSEITTFVRQEINLAKTEISEKLSKMGSNAVTLAIGGFVAYAGVIVLLLGLGALAAWGLEKAGLDTFIAGAVGIAGVGLLVVIIGVVMLMKGIKAFSEESLKPEKTVQTLQELKSSRHNPHQAAKVEDSDPTSEELKASVQVTEHMMSDTLGELGYRLSPSHIKAEVGNKISEQPYKYGAFAMAAGLLSGLWVKAKFLRGRSGC